MKHFIISILFPLLCLATSSCICNSTGDPTSKGTFVTPVANIVSNPEEFADEIVSVKGNVSGSSGLFSTSVFTLTDRSGSILVYCPSSMAPRDGETVKVSGQVHLVYRFRGKSFCYIKQLKNTLHHEQHF